MKHKHADLMALYAQDAQETDKPWERWEHGKYGAFSGLSSHPKWHIATDYRRKPEPRKPREFLVSLTESGSVHDCKEYPQSPERMGKCTIVRTLEIIEE